MRAWKIIQLCGLLPAGLLLLWIGVAIPVHFRTVSPVVLEEAGRGSEQLADRAAEYLNAGMLGPARLLEGASAESAARHAAVLERNPRYRFSGGPAPFFEQFLELAGVRDGPSQLIPLLVPAQRRAQLRDYLSYSANADVAPIVATAGLAGYQFFLPTSTPAGHPLDATVLTTAMLVQSGAFQTEVLRWLRTQRDAALAGDAAALAELESFYIAVFTLGTRLDWSQLTALLARIDDATTLRKAAALLHRDHVRLDALYAALILAPDAGGVVDYLEHAGERGWQVLEHALRFGSGALAEMVHFDRQMYRPPAFIAANDGLVRAPRDWLKGPTQRHPELAFGAKFLLFLGAGYMLALFISRIVEMRMHLRAPPGAGRYIALGHGLIALAVSGLIWVLIEPELLHFETNVQSRLQIRMAALVPGAAETLTQTENAMIDQVTILVLLMFFVMQLIVFVFCMVRIREVRRSSERADTKLALLENEEVLFDLGLYVGLGGTVASLILVTLNIVQASLMAAYASTLFGILFSAIVKVCVVRPYRRRLLLESVTHGTAPTSQR